MNAWALPVKCTLPLSLSPALATFQQRAVAFCLLVKLQNHQHGSTADACIHLQPRCKQHIPGSSCPVIASAVLTALCLCTLHHNSGTPSHLWHGFHALGTPAGHSQCPPLLLLAFLFLPRCTRSSRAGPRGPCPALPAAFTPTFCPSLTKQHKPHEKSTIRQANSVLSTKKPGVKCCAGTGPGTSHKTTTLHEATARAEPRLTVSLRVGPR